MPGSKESPERRTEVAQSRLIQVFKFLKALNELRNPVPPGPGPLPAYTEGGVCFQGMHSESAFNGYRCVRNQDAR